jgi:hypothetical protein
MAHRKGGVTHVNEQLTQCNEPPAPAPAPAPLNTKTPLTPQGGPPGPCLKAKDFLDAWNAVQGFVPARSLEGRRLRAFQARARDTDWLKDWRDALTRAARLPFCLGRNDRSWRATVDWFLRPDTVTKILEGAYNLNGSAKSETVEERLKRVKAEQAERNRPS